MKRKTPATTERVRALLHMMSGIAFHSREHSQTVTFTVKRGGQTIKAGEASFLESEKVMRYPVIYKAVTSGETMMSSLPNVEGVQQLCATFLFNVLGRICQNLGFSRGKIQVEIHGLHPLVATAMAKECCLVLESDKHAEAVEDINPHGYMVRIGASGEVEVLVGEFTKPKQSQPVSFPKHQFKLLKPVTEGVPA